MVLAGYVILGLIAGVLSGLIGIGGGIIIIPALVYLFSFTQHQAQGTTLALMIPPIGLLAALQYYKAGYVDIAAAGLICLGFLIGGLLGGTLAVDIADLTLKRIFGGILLLAGLQMLLGK
jgi:uncharacterized membrane protein YfcA